MSRFDKNRRIWHYGRKLVRPWIERKFNYTYETCPIQTPAIVLSNHNTDWDPILLGLAFPQYLSFVAVESIFRLGLLTKLIEYLFAPIPIFKGALGTETVLTVLRRIKEKVSVAIFAEGNRSFSGRTGAINPSTGKLVRISGASLVTYRLRGGYLSSPRWSGSAIRRGRINGSVVSVYSPETLRRMSVDEINEAIRRDLYVDAFADQQTELVPYACHAPAKGLERVLCICPKCRRLDTLRSKGKMLSCDCGFSVTVNQYGYFEGADSPYQNLHDWDEAQARQLFELADTQTCIFSDSDMILKEVLEGHRDRVLGRGDMALYRDRLECCGKVFPLSRLGGIALHGAQTVDLSCADLRYEISSKKIRCTRKYMQVIRYLKQAEATGRQGDE